MKWYSWIEPPVDAHEKSINQQTKRATYDKSKTTNEKLSMKRIEICLIQFCVIHVDLFLQNVQRNIRTKLD